MSKVQRKDRESMPFHLPLGRTRPVVAIIVLVIMFAIEVASTGAQTVTTVAGNGAASFGGDNGQATSAGLNRPRGVAFDASGNMYIADEMNHRIRRVTTGGVITTFAGNGTGGFSGDGGAAVNAQLNQPEDVFVDASGTVYIADSSNHRIRRVTSGGTISTVAGTGAFGFNGDSQTAVNAQLNRPVGITMDASGNLYIADASNHRIRKIATNGTISTVAGNGVQGYSGNGGSATSASLRFPVGIALDSGSNLYIADAGNHVVREVTPGGIIFNAAGNGAGAGTDSGSFSGDGGAAVSAGLNTPRDVVVDSAGNLFIADSANYRVRKVTPSGSISTVAGTGFDGFSGDGGLALAATFNLPWAVAMNASGSLFVGDMFNNRIRRISGAGGAALPLPSGAPSGGNGNPSVSSGGVLNNASYNRASLSMAPGIIAAVFGSNLTDGTSCMPPSCNPTFQSNGRLNTTMSGAQVTINGTAVPIFYSFHGQEFDQLGIQIPAELTGTSATVQVTVNGRTSAATTISLNPFTPGIFTFSSDGQGAGAITHADGSAVTAQNPSRRGEVVILYATGLGQVIPPVPTGMRPSGASSTTTTVTVFVDNIAVVPQFAGRSGCCVGLDQVNFQIPSNSGLGNSIPVRISMGEAVSNTVTIPVQ